MGYGIVATEPGLVEFLECGCLTTDSRLLPEERLLSLGLQLDEIFTRWEIDEVAIEELFFSKNVSTAIRVGEARGVALFKAAQNKTLVSEYNPTQIKEALTGYGKASKKQIEEAVIATLALDERPTPDDAADGLAIALTHIFYRDLHLC